jgi:hypothetical protein
MILRGQARGIGTVAPELAFEPETVFDELAKRDMQVHHQVT